MRLAILWESCGPYHFSRLNALRKVVGFDSVVAIELSPQNLTYDWRIESRESNRIHSLFPNTKSDKVPLIDFAFRLRKLLKSSEVSVLFVPSYWPAYSILAALVAKSLSLRVVFMGDSHYASGSNTGVAIIIKRFLIKAYDSAFVAGSLHRSFLRHLGMQASRVFDGYDTVDNDHFINVSNAARLRDVELRNETGLPPKYFLSLGRFVSKKNLESVIGAYASLVRRGAHADHHLVFVGSGPMQSRLEELAAALGLQIIRHDLGGAFKAPGAACVHFFPFAQIEAVPVFYALASAFILASTSDEWGLVVNEAMACACPVIVSRSVGSSLDLVIPNKTGFRFVPENVNELTWCLEALCNDLPQARRMGLAAREHIGAWSNVRFAENAVKAAKAALGEFDMSQEMEAHDHAMVGSAWFLQTCFPDYRAPVFNRLVERLGASFHLFSGTTYFTPDIKTTPDFLDWHSLVENRFLFGRRFLWQRGASQAMFQADVVVMELNPRIISNWLILAARALWGAPTLLWGHAWGRDDAHSIRNVLRLYMMRLASGTITYTRSQRDEVKSVFPSLRIFAATNSLISARDCAPLTAAAEELDTVLYVGRLNGPKKVQLLLEAFLEAQLPVTVKLQIVGDGVVRKELEQVVVARGAGQRVQLLGHVHNHEILRRLYCHSFCAVSPGYVGLGAIQAFSFGVPLVLADKEPHAPEVEACIPGENTVYFEAGSSKALAKTLEKMWLERAAWLSKRERLARWTAQNYSVEAMVEGFVEAIESVSAIRPSRAQFSPNSRPADTF